MGMEPELVEGRVLELPVDRAYSLLRQLWLEDTAVLRDLKNISIKIKAFIKLFGLNLYQVCCKCTHCTRGLPHCVLYSNPSLCIPGFACENFTCWVGCGHVSRWSRWWIGLVRRWSVISGSRSHRGLPGHRREDSPWSRRICGGSAWGSHW